MNYFADNIKYLRKITRKSQAEFAEMFGKAGSTVASWELNRRTPITADAIAIANHFHLKMNDLLFSNLAAVPDVLTYGEDEDIMVELFKKLPAADRQAVIAVVRSMVK